MSNCSHVALPKAKAVELAQACLDRIDAYKKPKVLAIILEEREAYEKSWWRKLWNKPVPSDDDIYDENLYFGSDLWYINSYAWRSNYIAKTIINAAKHLKDDDTIQVTLDDLDYIA